MLPNALRYLPLFALLPQAVCAAGFGELAILSRIGEPLRAEVRLLKDADENVSARCFSLLRGGENDLPTIQNATLSVIRRGDQYFLQIRGQRPLSEPLAQLKLQLGCASQVQREFVVMPLPPDSRISTPPSENENRPPDAVKQTSSKRNSERSPNAELETAAAQTRKPKSQKPMRTGDQLQLSSGLADLPPLSAEQRQDSETRMLRLETRLSQLDSTLDSLEQAMQLAEQSRALRHEMHLASALANPPPAATGLPQPTHQQWRHWLELTFGILVGGIASAWLANTFSQRRQIQLSRQA